MNDWKEKECEGQCVECGSEALDYGVSTIGEGYLYYDYECEDCGSIGEEIYLLKYYNSRSSKMEKI